MRSWGTRSTFGSGQLLEPLAEALVLGLELGREAGLALRARRVGHVAAPHLDLDDVRGDAAGERARELVAVASAERIDLDRLLEVLDRFLLLAREDERLSVRGER